MPEATQPPEQQSGFGAVPTWVIRGEAVTGSEVLVMLVISTYLGLPEVVISHATFSRQTGLSVSSVQRALRGLRDKGLISWDQRSGEDGGMTSNRYLMYVNPLGDGRPATGQEAPTPRSGRPTPRSQGPTPPVPVTDEVSSSEVPRTTTTSTSATRRRPAVRGREKGYT